MSNDLDEAERNAKEITSWAESSGYVRRAIECLIAHIRFHPAPPPLPSEANGGEASDEEPRTPGALELERVFIGGFRAGGSDADVGYRALYDLGKKHQASADAETIAGLRRVLALVEELPANTCDTAEIIAAYWALPAAIRGAK